MNYVQLEFTAQPETAEIITAILMEEGFEGVEEINEITKAYIKQADFNEQLIKSIFDKRGASFSTQIIPYKNWNAEWEANFKPVQVSNFVNVRASFHPPVKAVMHDIIINPKMSFGTGHHATTWLMMDRMKELDFNNKEVIDFGTGTGILAILAEKLGAARILAIDNDDNCIENASENFSINQCRMVELLKDDKISSRADIILANINRNIIILNLEKIADSLNRGGYVVLSGLLREDYDEINESLIQHNFNLLQKEERDNWICLLICKSL